ncbi:beta-galactosidase [Paenibacillus sp. p3-SID867]|uniref:glycoside hydrolase family 35 protein n=1 Tax=Paenibacillus sp. p3-SID867 TaxID=2916363 RepID=UPI0021A52786|nr:beta-galactosidase family protein [Paenibacillus sp. p3-SID867]MCT1403154.1 beta-galactosidase [Paenibacillus sp. p3-SID867]
MTSFMIQGDQFVMDGQPIRLLSGAIHYFRVVPEYWKDRLLKMKACGFNTVETYVAWNMHEPKEGQFNFTGMADIVKFIETATEVGLYVIIRPSPYICAEWEFGGMPAWLLADESMRLRCYDPKFLAKVDAYYDVLLPKLKPLLCTNGGPIIAMQVENEYGSYGNDLKYLEYLKEGMIARGMDVLLFTSDGPEDFMLQGGMIPGVLETVNFGSRTEEAFESLKQVQPDKPLMCMEYWNGWFDHWNKPHHTRDAQDAANVFEDMLKAGGSVNFYMFHGGTNFGFYNGANNHGTYEPTVTSYDYDSPLTEWGDITEKYVLVKETIERYFEVEPLSLPEPVRKQSYGSVELKPVAPLFDVLNVLSEPVQRTCPEPMEKLGQDYGFILYTTQVSGPRKQCSLELQEVHDRALVYVNGEYKGVIERWDPKPIEFEVPEGGAELRILVENMGRTNYCPYLRDYKGITEGARLGFQFLFNWTIHTLPLDNLGLLNERAADQPAEASSPAEGPAFYKGSFHIADEADIADTFLKFEGWTKGVAYVNGFNLGRYWEAGPQKALYVPAPLLRAGDNEIMVFELHGTSQQQVMLQDHAELG